LFLPQKIIEFGYGKTAFQARGSNAFIVGVMSIILSLILVYGFGRPDAIGGDRGSPSPLYEYSIILFLASFYFAGDKKSLNGVLAFLLVLFAGQNLIYGGRVTALQLLLVFFFIFLSSRMTWRSILPFLALAFALLVTIGNLRTDFIGADFSDMVESLQDILRQGLAWDTAFSSWHTSITFLLYGDMVNIAEHFRLFGQWLLSIFFGGSVEDSGLAIITRNFYAHYYGGTLPIFFQFYLGPLGVIAVAGYVAVIMNWTNKVCSENGEGIHKGKWQPIATICTLYVSVTTFRWFLYSPSQITRGLLLCALVSLALFWVNEQMTAKRTSLGKVGVS
jgi:hypothetical protein